MEVKWFSGAKDDLARLRYYCEFYFGKTSAQNIIKHVLQTVGLLGSFPEMGALEPLLDHRPETWRSLVVHKNIKVVYLIGSQSVNIAALWDTRQRPTSMTSYIGTIVENEPTIVNEPTIHYQTKDRSHATQ